MSLFDGLRPVLLDGAMGTALMKRGLPPGAPGEIWNLENPDAVKAVHAGYIRAGSDVVQTNTFGGTTLRLAGHGLESRFEEINREAVRVAREAAGDRLVAGNLGPSGLFMPPVGKADPAALEAAYLAQAEVLAKAGVQAITIETMLDLEEALLALRGARQGAPGLPVSVCMIFEKKKRGFFSPMGNRPAEAAMRLADEGADLVGANCSMGSKEMLEMAVDLIAAVKIPVVMKPNAGLPETKGTQVVYRQEPDDFAGDLLAMVKMGARVVGGCCGTDERFIGALRRGLDAL
jgi:5-methyltetrahydrofolate--homocysteine methyltransferase